MTAAVAVRAKTERKNEPHRLSHDEAADHAEILRAVAHPLRLRILGLLCTQEMSVNAMAELLGAAQAMVSQQLRILRMTQLVDVTREGGGARYRLAEPHIRELIACVDRCGVRRSGGRLPTDGESA